eukprot:1723474-Alexandrium_andersonii.AAC.1
MSASLVGSEMCIRDRRPPGRRAAGRRGTALDRAAAAVAARPGVQPPAACLLYTSDAADDM